MPGPSLIADEVARLSEVFEEIRRELAYLQGLAVAQLTILQNEEDLKIMDTVVLNGQVAGEHVAHMIAASDKATIIIAEMLVIYPPA